LLVFAYFAIINIEGPPRKIRRPEVGMMQYIKKAVPHVKNAVNVLVAVVLFLLKILFWVVAFICLVFGELLKKPR